MKLWTTISLQQSDPHPCIVVIDGVVCVAPGTSFVRSESMTLRGSDIVVHGTPFDGSVGVIQAYLRPGSPGVMFTYYAPVSSIVDWYKARISKQQSDQS